MSRSFKRCESLVKVYYSDAGYKMGSVLSAFLRQKKIVEGQNRKTSQQLFPSSEKIGYLHFADLR